MRSIIQGLCLAASLTTATIATPQRIPAPLPDSAQTLATPAPANLFSPRRVSTLPFPVQMHGTAVVGNRLYIFGGNVQDIGYTEQVWAAVINQDGTLGPWMPQEPLPELRHYTANAVEVINDTIYMCGGTIADDRRSTATREINDVLYTTVRKDGTLSPWKRSAPFGAPRTLLATAHTPTHLYITGGARQRPLDDIISATILPNGDLGPWTSIGRLPRPLWFHGAAILDNRMYIWGGLTGPKNSTASNAVWSAEVNRDGSLGQWRPEVPMPVGIYSAANSGFNDYLVTIGGRLAGGQPTNDITVAKLERGRVGRWQTLPTDLHTRYFHSLGLDETRGWIFVTGGRLRREPTDNSRILVNEVRGFQVSNSPAPPSPVLAKLGFLDPATARTKALGLGNRSILLYFRSPEVPSCQRFEESLQSSELVASHLSGIVPAVVDVSKDPQLSYNYGIFKVPSVAIVGPSGTLIRSATSLRTANDLIEFLRR